MTGLYTPSLAKQLSQEAPTVSRASDAFGPLISGLCGPDLENIEQSCLVCINRVTPQPEERGIVRAEAVT